MSNHAEGWITEGFSKGPNGEWLEMGAVGGIQTDSESVPPEIPVHDVPALLDKLEPAMSDKSCFKIRCHQCGKIEERNPDQTKGAFAFLVHVYPWFVKGSLLFCSGECAAKHEGWAKG